MRSERSDITRGGSAPELDARPFAARERDLAVALCGCATRREALDALTRALRDLDVEGDRHALRSLADVALRRLDREALLRDERDASFAMLRAASDGLRDPLHAVHLGAQVLRRGAEGPRAQVVDGVSRGARVALRVVDDLRALGGSRPEGASLATAREDVFALLESCADQARARATAGRAVVVVRPERGGDAEVDAAQLAQCLGNVLSRALGASPPGARLLARAAGDARSVRVTVEAPCEGAEVSRAAEMCADDVPLRAVAEQGSAGLTMFLAARIAAAHGGRAWAEAGWEGGVRYGVELPRGEG